MTPGLSEDIGVMYAHTFSKLANHLAQIHTSLSEPKASTNKLYFINQVSYICPYNVFVIILQPIYTEARVKSNGNSDVMNLKAVIMAQWT